MSMGFQMRVWSCVPQCPQVPPPHYPPMQIRWRRHAHHRLKGRHTTNRERFGAEISFCPRFFFPSSFFPRVPSMLVLVNRSARFGRHMYYVTHDHILREFSTLRYTTLEIFPRTQLSRHPRLDEMEYLIKAFRSLSSSVAPPSSPEPSVSCTLHLHLQWLLRDSSGIILRTFGTSFGGNAPRNPVH